MRAARLFALRLASEGVLAQTATVRCWLHGSLGATGKGHGSDTAVLLGLMGQEPDTVDVDTIPALIADVRATRNITLAGGHTIAFNEKSDLLFMRAALPFHPNGMRLAALDGLGHTLCDRTYYSVGGGFVVSEEVAADGTRHKTIAPDATVLPLPFTSGNTLLAQCQAHSLSIAQLMRRNEQHWRSNAEIDAGLARIWHCLLYTSPSPRD